MPLTRSSTLQGGSGAHQNGSIKVRSEVQLADEGGAAFRQTGDVDDFEADYFDELSSPNLIKTVDAGLANFDSDRVAGSSPMPRPISPVERLFGDGPEPEMKELESRWSMTYDCSETPGKFEVRPQQLSKH